MAMGTPASTQILEIVRGMTKKPNEVTAQVNLKSMQGSHLRLSNVSNGSFGGQSRSMLGYFSLLTHCFQVLFVANTAA